ncbi:CZB domain-containing protein [uncultured Thiodictyon sp.]|uniref:CZB domain-containing protein n=1 Tax=uncultured Thiodictyon sp. TaxID=1846217 RepID=UPI0025FFAC55|nr:CZB domain-containing protein [uncultured Thiodictyon sp.]
MGAFFLHRLNDHLQYLNRIKATLSGTGDFRGTGHRDCKLGKWMDTAGPAEAAEVGREATAVFDSLAEPHQQFHEASAKALELALAGEASAAEEEITAMYRLSALLVDRLLELDRLSGSAK